MFMLCPFTSNLFLKSYYSFVDSLLIPVKYGKPHILDFSEQPQCYMFYSFVPQNTSIYVKMLPERGPGPKWVCLGPASSVWLLDFV